MGFSYSEALRRLQELSGGMWFDAARYLAIDVARRALCDCGLDPVRFMQCFPEIGDMGEIGLSQARIAYYELEAWRNQVLHVDPRRLAMPTGVQLAKGQAIRACIHAIYNHPPTALVQATIRASESAAWHAYDGRRDRLTSFSEFSWSPGVFARAIWLAEMQQIDSIRRPMARCEARNNGT